MANNNSVENETPPPILEKDPKLKEQRDRFLAVFEQIFSQISDQRLASIEYLKETSRGLANASKYRSRPYPKSLVTIPRGTIVKFGMEFRILSKPYTASILSTDYMDFASELPDGSIMRVPSHILVDNLEEQHDNRRSYAKCSYCGGAYSTENVRVLNGKINEIHDPECQSCGAKDPIPVEQ